MKKSVLIAPIIVGATLSVFVVYVGLQVREARKFVDEEPVEIERVGVSCPRDETHSIFTAEDVERAKQSPENVCWLELQLANDHVGDAFPEWVLEMKNLRLLKIEGGTEMRTLPEEISQLERLEVLIITTSAVESLPESIGKLSNLRYLDVRGNNINALPDSIANLEKLEFLKATDNNISAEEAERLAELLDEDIDVDFFVPPIDESTIPLDVHED